MQIGPGWVEAFLDPQRFAALELGFELGFDDQLIRATFEDGQLVGNVDGHGCGGGGTGLCYNPAVLERLRDRASLDFSLHVTGTVLSNRRILAQSGTSFGRHLVAGRAAAIMILTGAGVVAAFAFAPDTLTPTDPAQRIVRELSLPALAPVARIAGYWREERIQRGDTLGSVLARLGIDDGRRRTSCATMQRARPPYQLRPGKAVRVQADDDVG